MAALEEAEQAAQLQFQLQLVPPLLRPLPRRPFVLA
jgi:hypothetical protein